MAMLPSSLPLGVRTVEWLRMHHFNWLVDETEHFYYSWQTPAKGGAQLKTLPTVGLHAKVDHGRLSPNLNNSTEWGFTLGNAVRVWRTGLGIDRRGNLIYAAADYQTVTTLAEILKRAGAVRAMELDINPEWPTLITYRHRQGLLPTKVVPNYQQPATRYLVPDDRDFFAVYTRQPGPVTVPLK